ncbi:MAG: MurR/RpiR family transcriptional regulator, partial [Bacillota bacterium]
AAKCGVSDATVVRLCKRLRMHGYQELKVTLAQDIVSPLERIHEAVTESDSCGEVMSKVFRTTIQALQYTERIVNRQQLEQAVAALDEAQRIVILGMGNSAAVAKDMQHKLLRLGLQATAYDDNHMSRIVCTHLKPGDVCVCISHSGSSRDVVDAARMAHDNGAKVISMTGVGKSPLSETADIRLETASKEAQYHILALASRIAQYTLIDSIYTSLAIKRREGKGECQQDIERALEKLKY